MFKFFFNPCYKQFPKHFHFSIEDDYKKSIAALNLLQSNMRDITSVLLPQKKLEKVNVFLSKCGLEINELEKQLSVIHVSGTKGKGSTCAFCESILRNYGFKTGFFSSPHLVTVRERIRINGYPISREKFSGFFWDIYRKLAPKDGECDILEMPSYFMFLTIMAFKIFKEEKVEVAIIEVGIGGEYDYTNVLSNTAVVGISSLGFDHVNILGNTIEEIAWHKAGIMKPGCIAVTSSDQQSVALNVLQKRAIKEKCSLFVTPSLNKNNYGNAPSLGIKGPAQIFNASLAVQLVNAWLNPQNYHTENFQMSSAPSFQLSHEMLDGLVSCRWPGRTQIFNHSSKLIYYLDGAHTLESIRYSVTWFQQTVLTASPKLKKILIFNMTGSRNASQFMEFFIACKFDYVFFCSNRIKKFNNDIYGDNTNLYTSETAECQRLTLYREEWLKLNKSDDNSNIKLFYDVAEAHDFISNLSDNEEHHVLVTGSLHLVGSFLSLIDPELKLSYENSK